MNDERKPLTEEEYLKLYEMYVYPGGSKAASLESALLTIEKLRQELSTFKRAFPKKPPSDEFMRALCHTGSTSILCEFCGRVHFAGGPASLGYEENEFEQLLEKAKTEPEKYVEDPDVDAIAWGNVDGRQFPWGCPCNSARRYEDWIWTHRYLISDYLKGRAARMKREADEAEHVAGEAKAGG